jgi:hypothetical protein
MGRLFLVVALLFVGCKGEPRVGECTEEALAVGAQNIPNEGWNHVEDESELVYNHNPPASGPHFPQWAGYQVHTEVIKRGNWVHNLEHGAIVFLIGPNASEDQRQLMLDAYEALPNDPDCGHRRALVTEDPLLDSAFAVVAADIILDTDDATLEDILTFAQSCRDRAPEDICL